MEAIGLLVKLEARPGKEAEAEAFLKSAQPLALDEKATLKWYAIKLAAGKFGTFDTFANEAGRNAHLTGEIAKALTARASELFAVPPQVEKVKVLANTPLKGERLSECKRECGFWLQETTEEKEKKKEKEMKIKEKEMKTSQTYRAGSAQEPKSALRGLMQRVGLTVLACTLVIGAAGSANAGEARDEAAVRALGDTFAKAFVQKDAELRASLFAENGTFVTPVGDFLQGRAAMVKDFGPEAQQAVNGTTQAAFSNYRVRFIKPDVAVVDALLTVRNVNGPDGTIIPVIPINFFYVAARHGDRWLIEDGRAHFAPAPANSMTSRN